MPQTENSTSEETVQLKHILLDVDFYDKPKVKALAYKHGQLAVHLYVRWLTLMSRASNALVTRDALGAIAHEVGFHEEAFSEILTYCINTGMLFESEDKEISNSRVLQDQLSCAVKRKEAKERQSKYRENKRVTNALPTRFPVSVSVPVSKDPDPNKIKVLDFLYFDEISIDTWKAKLGIKQFERACEKLNGWIGQSQGTPEFQSRKTTGENASFALQNWVSNAVLNEKSEKPKTQDPPRPRLKPVVMPWEEPGFKPMKL